MRALYLLAMFLFVSADVTQAQSALVPKSIITLNYGWTFRQRAGSPGGSESQWHPAEVPGVVHTDLLRNKMIADPFYRDNESRLQWIGDADWEYRTTVQATREMLNRSHVELEFEGLDGYAEVFLNNSKILSADNMFREWRLEVKSLLKPGANELLVVFPSVLKQAQKVASLDKWHERSLTDAKTYIRKAAYEYGWDWGPRLVTTGLWRPVRLELWDTLRISDLHIRQLDVHPEVAHLEAEAEIVAAQNSTALVVLCYFQNGKKENISRSVELAAGTNHIHLPIDVQKPDLWYPNGYGQQPLYHFDLTVRHGSFDLDQRSVRTGLRSVTLRRDLDKWGRSFEFVVNGIPVFAKGANVIPFDSFPTRATSENYRQILQSAKDAHMNMVRLWGGGYYGSDEFYELCDELGIMVWQDFMFGNDWQPGTYDFKLNVAHEAEEQVRRLRNHPSIVLWCGNNETEFVFLWNGRAKLDALTLVHMWGDYVAVFNGALARVVERLTPEIPYWPSSPSADYEDTSDTYQSGDMHNWDIWHGPMLPINDYEKFFPRFMSEYGFQSFPAMSTIEKFTLPEDRNGINSSVLLAHQKNSGGNEIIHDYMRRDYPEPKDFPSFAYMSQVLQAEAVKIGAEHLRRNRPRTMGSLYWQLNDCWPVVSWSSIDYYGNWKALQYYARRFYADLLISPRIEDNRLAIYVVSDKTTATTGKVRVRIMTMDGTILREATKPVQIQALSSKIYMEMQLRDFASDPARTFGFAELLIDDRVVSSNLTYFVPTRQISLPPAHIQSELVQTGDSYRLRLSSQVLARSVNLSFEGSEAQVSDNFFDLLPGHPVEIEIHSSAGLAQLRRALKVISLADALASPEPKH